MADYTQPEYVSKRLRFYDGQFLREQDFVDEQRYHIDRQRRHDRLLHAPGVADGLEVTSSEVDQVSVAPGTAVDAQGRMILLVMPEIVDLTAQRGRTVLLTIAYQEEESDLATAGSAENTRWLERALIEATPEAQSPAAEYPVVLARLDIDAGGVVTVDESVRAMAGLALPGGPVLRSDVSGRAVVDASLGVLGELTVTGKGTVAGLDVTGNLSVTGPSSLAVLTVAGNLGVGGQGTLAKLTVTGAASVAGDLGVTGSSASAGTLSTGGDLIVAGQAYLGDGTNRDLLTLKSSRAWKFTATGSGAGVSLDLQTLVNEKSFRVVSRDGVRVPLEVFASTTAGANRALLVQNGGQVGIGTNDPDRDVTVFATGQTTGVYQNLKNSNHEVLLGVRDTAILSAMTASDLELRTNNQPRLVIKADTGNVGIGTPSPRALLEVSGGNLFLGNNNRLRFESADGVTGAEIFSWTDNTLVMDNEVRGASIKLRVANNDNRVIVLDGAGQVGIGTVAPEARLQVVGGSDASLSGGGFLVLGSLSGTNVAIDNNEIMARNNGQAATLSVQHGGGSLSVHGAQEASTRFVILNDGRVGIGTSSPSWKLHVVGRRIRLVNPSDSSHYLDLRADGAALDIESRGAPLYLNNHGEQDTRIRRFVNLSSREYKEEIADLTTREAHRILEGLRSVTFRFKDDSTQTPHIGFVAEEVPGAVATNDRVGVRPVDILAVLTRVIQDQQVDIVRLRQRLSELEGQAL